MKSILLDTIETKLCPDVVEWNPTKNLLLCGTYEVLESEATSVAFDINRCGSITLLSLQSEKLKVLQSIETEAIFDLKWEQQDSSDTQKFITGDSKGNATLYEVDKYNKINLTTNLQILDKSLAVSIDWKKSANQNQSFLITGSNGEIANVVIKESEMKIEAKFKAHEFECWTATFDKWSDNIFYSGGDDSMFLTWDLRCCTKPSIRNKVHNAGVCFVTCNPFKENQVLTGSYDECIRVWDTRNLRRQPLFERNLGGGVWKVKWHSKKPNIITVPCMYNGLKILGIDKNEVNMLDDNLIKPGPLTYGADWENTLGNNDTSYIASCTFYDKKINLHKVSIEGSSM